MENPYDPPATTKDESFRATDAAVRTGRVIVICVIALSIGFSLMTIVLYNALSGTQRLPVQLVRFALTVGLAVCLYKGQLWARYVMAVLFSIAVVFSVFVIPAMINNANPLLLAYFAAMTVAYLASAIALIAFPSVGRFMEHQRR